MEGKDFQTNFTLIDRPEVIAGLEFFDLAICGIVALVFILPLSLISGMFFGLYPILCIFFAIYAREKKKGKNFGYFRRLLHKMVKRRTRKVVYVK